MKIFTLTNAQFDMVFAALRWAADSDYNEFTEPLTRRERLALDRGIEAMKKAGPPCGSRTRGHGL